MIEEAYVSFETSKLLKEKGFDGDTSSFYILEDGTHHIMSEKVIQNEYYESQDSNEHGHLIQAPTQQMVIRWLREVHNIHIIAEPCLGEGNEPNLCFNRWFWTILKEDGEYEPIRKIDEFPTYEEACEEAIKYCLENLI